MIMEPRLPIRKQLAGHRAWHGAAFILEALALLVFMMAFAVVLVQLFAATASRSIEAERLTGAIALATNDAETFAADPTLPTETFYYAVQDGTIAIANETDLNALAVTRSVHTEVRDNGIMYYADITVSQGNETIYEISTARYVGNEEAAR
ncbi:hypothetical protein CE91St30_27430 [Raoultibacter timonensis]|uniref:Uncharacterized protein n=2 Tax=Raoultibacter timonensis TaxID=1907662 RepID=A0ABM7WLZ6_9ACTN|nr:hypothetical protein CE91St30_27430 [Raoultibacter timonensis]BDF52013.1 hypothetical protein CE91St31_27430 [Raoultibacter timonensis]